MKHFNLRVLALLPVALLSACSSVGNKLMMEPISMLEPISTSITKSAVVESMGPPWDILIEPEYGTTGWLYLYMKKVVSNPLTYVPYAGFLLGGGDVTIYTRFYCFNSDDAFTGRVMSKEKMYKSIFSEYAAMFDSSAMKERKARLETENEKYGFEFDPEKKASVEWHHWLRDAQVPAYQKRLFEECHKNGLSELNKFVELL